MRTLYDLDRIIIRKDLHGRSLCFNLFKKKVITNKLTLMGNYSWLITTMNGADKCEILWDACNFSERVNRRPSEAYHITWLKVDPSRPKTVKELAERLHDRKLFGYLDNGYIEAFIEICRHMRMPEGDNSSFPRMYFEEEGWQRLHYLEFHPGTDVVIWGVHSFTDEDLPSEEEQEPTEEQIESYKRAERRAFMSMIANAEWKTARLTPVVNE
ncbi:MAG: hypothetical protein P4L69_24405, partial [Desulfosporosinus sp.]|nr:hypothetical protein [Desulfosporosinus sp.]